MPIIYWCCRPGWDSKFQRLCGLWDCPGGFEGNWEAAGQGQSTGISEISLTEWLNSLNWLTDLTILWCFIILLSSKAKLNRLDEPKPNKVQINKQRDRDFLKRELADGRLTLKDYMTAMGTVLKPYSTILKPYSTILKPDFLLLGSTAEEDQTIAWRAGLCLLTDLLVCACSAHVCD